MLNLINNENFDSHYHDLKDPNDLMIQIFEYTLNEIKLIKNYTDNEINKMAHSMVLNGWLRGGAANGKAYWDKVTALGKVYYKQYKKGS
jgi:hypothetical protein